MQEPSTPYYDDPSYSYPAFWHGREYEHEAEIIAIRTLLGRKRFSMAADIGGGFGRLASFLTRYGPSVVLIEPSEIQRSLAHQTVPRGVSVRDGTASRTGLPDASCDLAVMVRVFHHLPEPKESIAEIHRILKPGGLLVLEFANSLHIKSRLRQGLRLRRVSTAPVHVSGSEDAEVPFVNHHPRAMYDALAQQGFVVEKVLSVSNVRSPFLKRLLPIGVLLWIEKATQRALGRVHFGPSIFVLARRV